jgi:hypothetical protein
VFTGFWLVDPKGRDHWENLGVDGTIILKWALGRGGIDGVNLIRLAQDRV